MVTKAEFNERMDTVDNRLAALEHRATGLESKVNGIHRRLDEEAMERTDITALLERMSKVEKHVGFDAK
jgi:predicted RNase H-like nuclease (RuvC/YqgF family)